MLELNLQQITLADYLESFNLRLAKPDENGRYLEFVDKSDGALYSYHVIELWTLPLARIHPMGQPGKLITPHENQSRRRHENKS